MGMGRDVGLNPVGYDSARFDCTLGECGEICERETATHGARKTPSQATRSCGVEEGASESEGVENLGAVAEIFELHRSEGNAGIVQSLGDWGEGFFGAGENGYAEFAVFDRRAPERREPFRVSGDAVGVAVDELDHLGDLGFVGLQARG